MEQNSAITLKTTSVIKDIIITSLKSKSNTFLDYFGSEWQNTKYFWKVIKTQITLSIQLSKTDSPKINFAPRINLKPANLAMQQNGISVYQSTPFTSRSN